MLHWDGYGRKGFSCNRPQTNTGSVHLSVVPVVNFEWSYIIQKRDTNLHTSLPQRGDAILSTPLNIPFIKERLYEVSIQEDMGIAGALD